MERKLNLQVCLFKSFLGYLNLIMLYEGIMTPIEILDNIDRLPVQISSIYEPHLEESMVIYPNNTPEYNTYLNTWIENKFSLYTFLRDIPISEMPEIADLPSDPISACQFHLIKVIT